MIWSESMRQDIDLLGMRHKWAVGYVEGLNLEQLQLSMQEMVIFQITDDVK